MLAANLLVLGVPVIAVMLLRLYEQHLVSQTEGRLIAEATLIGEAWRHHLLLAGGQDATATGRIQPPGQVADPFFPYEPVIDLHAPLASDPGPPARQKAPADTPPWIAGRALKPMLDRAKLVNLSGARVLDDEGCVVASTADTLGECLDAPEVRAALGGRYQAVARPRGSESRAPPGGISRGGDLRVFIALPLFSDGRVIGVVRMSRTILDVPQALWPYRQVLLVASLGCLLLTALVSLFLARAIVRPVRGITAVAEAIARADERPPPPPGGRVPAEVFQLSAALDTMTERLRARAAYIAEFAANVSHELKTPLTGVRGAVELLREAWPDMDDATRARFLDNVDADAERMQRLVSGLLALARIEHAAGELEAVDVAETLARVVARYGDRVQLDAAGAPATMKLPADHLATAVGNLVDNALRHGGAATVVARGLDGGLEIRVTDPGPGISEGNRARVFDRFFTTERDAGGTGLGLAIVQAIAQARGGRVEYLRATDATTFRLWLPGSAAA
ncbi:MAG: HAMP domain-containing protein [Myxococcales bacterium]|nr:HAMP domain-containing protein [Myxococcales bacterium]